MKNKANILIFCWCCLLSINSISQKQFSVQVTFDKCLSQNKYDFRYIDNFVQKKPIITVEKNKYSISGEFKNEFCILEVREIVDTSKNNNTFYSYFFFIQNNSKSIDFTNCDTSKIKNSFKDYNLNDVIDVKDFEKKYFSTIRREYLDVNNYQDSLEAQFEVGNTEAYNKQNLEILQQKNIKLEQKQIDYILLNKNDFYSFWKFKDIALLTKNISSDSLLQIFNVFPDNFKTSDNGKTILSIISGRKMNIGSVPTFFNTIDIDGKPINLEQFKGKVILINFWATWCGPCRVEIPELISLRKKYPKNIFEMISISQDSDIKKFNSFIKKNKMNWVHIYNDDNLFKGFAVEGLPKTILIDESGKVFSISLGTRSGELTEILSKKLGF